MRNWAGNQRYAAGELHRPQTEDELCALLAAAPRIRVLGTRHSFNAIADSEQLVSLAALTAPVTVTGGAVELGGATTYAELAPVLDAHGRALHNLASLPHIAVAGAVATATHGSGDASGNLATAVRELELVTSAGEVVVARRGEPGFDGMVVGLGALGAVTRLVLDTEPAYTIAQRVYEGLAWDALLERLDAIMAAGDSVSVFTRWGAAVDQVWVKERAGRDRPELFGARPATRERHPILGLDPVNCTAQLGRAGPWWDRLPHFRMGFTPSAGAELQSELHVPREHAAAAIAAVRALADTIAPLVLVSELRTVAADALWMSPQHGRATLGIHFTWKPEPGPVARAIAAVEDALAPFDPRPHWGKLFALDPAGLSYERRADFAGLVRRLDPRGAFSNAWLRALIG